MAILGAALLGVVWGWLLLLVSARAPRGVRAAAALVAGSALVAAGLGAVHGGGAVPWFAAGVAFGLLAHAAWREELRRRSARQNVEEGGTR